MKKTSKFLIVAILIITLSVLLMACTEKDDEGLIKLSTPTNVVVSGDSISWDSVEHANKYYVLVEGVEEEYTTTATSYKLSVSQVGTYNVQVRAYGDGVKYGTSDYSEIVKFIKGQTLPEPQVAVDEAGKVTWNEVEFATSYYVTVKNRDKKLVKQFSTTERSYDMKNEADKELYKNPNAYMVTVKAVPAQDDLTHRESLESKAVKYIKQGQLDIPKFNSITSTTVWWNKVDKNIKEYDNTLIVKYEIKLEYVDADGTNKVETYLSTNDNMGIANFNLPVAGEYKMSIRAIGDEVFKDSAFCEVKPEYNLIKLPKIDPANITFTQNDLSGELAWSVPSIENIGRFNVVLETYKADGTKALTTSEYVAVREEGEEGSKTPVLNYSFNVRDLFYKIDKADDKKRPEPTKNDDEYYGRTYNISIIAVRDSAGVTASNRIIESDKTTIDQTYVNYIKPVKVEPEHESAYYLVDTMSQFAYIKYEPSATYVINSNIDFRGYPIEVVPEFTGNIIGNNFTLKNMVIQGAEDATDIALFGNMKGSISDLFFNNVRIKYNNVAERVATIAAVNEGNIDNVYVTGDIKAHQYNKEIKEEDKIVAKVGGGIVAVNKKNLTNAVANVNVTGNIAGGLVGINNGVVSYSYALGEVKASNNSKIEGAQTIYAGGLVGLSEQLAAEDSVMIMNSFADNKVSASSTKNDKVRAGGVIAINNQNCTIQVSYAGGMFSFNVVSKVEVVSSGIDSITGGFVAENYGTINSAYTTLKAVATTKAAGFAGINGGTILYSYSAGGVGNNGIVGGFVTDSLDGAKYTDTVDGKEVNTVYYTKPNNSFVTRANEVGEMVENKKIETLNGKLGSAFGKFEDNPAPALKGMIYVEEYKLKTKANAVNAHVGKILDVASGKEVKLYSDPAGDTFKYLCPESDAVKRGNTVRARYNSGELKMQILVTIR